MRVEIIFAEIGDRSLKVDVDHFKRFFPHASIRIIDQGKCIGDRNSQRWGWRMNDYHKVRGLVESQAEVAISFDADMRIVSDEIRAIERIAIDFGLCLPVNPRRMVKVDNSIGADAGRKISEELGLLHAVNCGIIALYKKNERAVDCAQAFLRIMETTPMRGPMAWAQAFSMTGFSPCLLPAQWCVCAEDIGIGNEIALHVGHDKVREFYAALV